MLKALRLGDRGETVEQLQEALASGQFPPGALDGIFGPATEAAVLGFQRSAGLLADGVVGPKTWEALGLNKDAEGDKSASTQIGVAQVAQMFPYTPLGTISRHLPSVLKALRRHELLEKPMVLVALATIRAESEGFEPVSEWPSRFNTSPNGHPFDLYDFRRDLGNRGRPDGATFRGRGFIQLTGRSNYAATGRYLGLGNTLEQSPELANDPEMAAQILAAFLAMRRVSIKRAIIEGDWRRVRRLVNGGSHGLERFLSALRIGDRLIEDPVWQGSFQPPVNPLSALGCLD